MLSQKKRVATWINCLSVFAVRFFGHAVKHGVRQVPSTEGQWKLLRLLQAQLEEMGLVKVTLSEKGR